MMKKLKDICEIQYGYAFDSKCFTDDSAYPQLARIRDVKRGYSDTYYSGEYSDEYVLLQGTYLLEWMANSIYPSGCVMEPY